MKVRYPPGATPIDPDELAQLIPNISTQGDLNNVEALNIASGEAWALRSWKLRRDLLTVPGLLLLHARMFGDTWRWAGKFRKSDKNIGVDKWKVLPSVQELTGNVRFWIDNGTYPWPELAIRFHHKLVWIHPFANGNGRHARLAADLLLVFAGEPRLPWGDPTLSLVESTANRDEYIGALKEADRGRYERLIHFACGGDAYR